MYGQLSYVANTAAPKQVKSGAQNQNNSIMNKLKGRNNQTKLYAENCQTIQTLLSTLKLSQKTTSTNF